MALFQMQLFLIYFFNHKVFATQGRRGGYSYVIGRSLIQTKAAANHSKVRCKVKLNLFHNNPICPLTVEGFGSP